MSDQPVPPRFPPAEPPAGPAGHPIHPLTVSRTISLAIRLVRFGWRTIFAIVLLFFVPLYVIVGAVQAAIMPMAFEFAAEMQAWMVDYQRQLAGGELPAFLPPLGTLIDFLLLNLAISMATALIGWYGQAAVVHAIGQVYLERRPTIGGSIGQVVRRLVPLTAAWLLIGAVMLGVLLAGVIAGAAMIATSDGGAGAFLGLLVVVSIVAVLIFLTVRWLLVPQTLMLEESSGVGALGRSWRLVAGSSWRVLGYLLLLMIMVGLIVAALGAVVGLVFGLGTAMTPGNGLPLPPSDPAFVFSQTLLSGLLAAVFEPFLLAAFVLLYHDLRWRRGETGRDSVAEEQVQPGL
ncbi:MAG TPA: hypothetical protein VNW68_08455 [Candidatus Limnocylindria bacterium]|nr:hypothetical protein [Candidatus Limnocylindria bacterium]